MNDTETISMLVTFANTIFSEHPNTFFLIAKCDISSSDFINISNNCIEGEFEMTVGEETKIYKPGMLVKIPSNVVHSGKAITDCKLTDVFCPCREEYK